jgi:hypothetical protein
MTNYVFNKPSRGFLYDTRGSLVAVTEERVTLLGLVAEVQKTLRRFGRDISKEAILYSYGNDKLIGGEFELTTKNKSTVLNIKQVR